ncbi:hypothetical protein GTO10_01425 [Candidatus Saccharibacteria bacterium]|nr:hypothetical protein [Candidatus Saccharibacteria bacterium]
MAVWVMDLDETLIRSEVDYGRAILRFGLLMIDTFGDKFPGVFPVLELRQKVGNYRFRKMRASREAFPGSLAQSYQLLCQRTGTAGKPLIEQMCWAIGYSAISAETYEGRELLPGVERTLDFLKSKGDILYCITAGDERVQWDLKHPAYGLGRWFPDKEHFRVVEWEKEEELGNIRARHPNGPVIMVGDSKGSDLWPAYRVGMIPVYVYPISTWDHGELVDELPPGTVELSKIDEIVGLYDTLVAD